MSLLSEVTGAVRNNAERGISWPAEFCRSGLGAIQYFTPYGKSLPANQDKCTWFRSLEDTLKARFNFIPHWGLSYRNTLFFSSPHLFPVTHAVYTRVCCTEKWKSTNGSLLHYSLFYSSYNRPHWQKWFRNSRFTCFNNFYDVQIAARKCDQVGVRWSFLAIISRWLVGSLSLCNKVCSALIFHHFYRETRVNFHKQKQTNEDLIPALLHCCTAALLFRKTQNRLRRNCAKCASIYLMGKLNLFRKVSYEY